MSNKTKARLLIGMAIAILLAIIPLVAMAQNAPSQPAAINSGYQGGSDWDPCDWFPSWPGCQPPPEKCYGDCPKDQTFSGEYEVFDHYVYAEKIDEYGWVCPSGWTIFNTNQCKKYYSGSWHYQAATWGQTGDKVCPAGYEEHNQSGPLDCRKKVYVTHAFSVTFDYEEDGDECERPSTSDLNVPDQLKNAFIAQFPRTIDRPEVPCYETCSETVLLAKVYGPVLDVGAPVWGPWIDNGDGTFTRTGSQATTQHWTQTTVDTQDPQHVCGVDEGDDAGSREVKETQDGATRYTVGANCEEGFVTALYFDPDGTQVGSDIVAEYVWSNPFDLESHLFEQYDLTANEPEDCHEIEVKIDFADEDPPDCIGWAVYRYTYVDGELYSTELAGSGTWTDAYSDESFTFTDDKSGLSLYVAEPEDCLNREGAYIVYDQTCERGWQAALFDVETDTLQDTASDSWHDPFGPESVSGTLHWTDLNGEEHSVDYFLSKNTDCIDCKVQEWYPMAGYQTFDAPVGYWSGPLERGPGICPIIHKVGEIPSLERILEICSLCKDQIPGGYLYNPSNGNGTMFTDERVLKITCWTETRGHETHYYWAGKLWDQWIKSGFEPDGTRTCNRIDGCSQEIRDMAAERGIEIP